MSGATVLPSGIDERQLSASGSATNSIRTSIKTAKPNGSYSGTSTLP
jgi:hypothetical protein